MKERFEAKIEKAGDGQCWNWTGAISNCGYGRFFLDGKNRTAHRIAWELENGEIPKGLCVLHRCDNPRCVNPAHLFIGSHKENMHDRDRKGRLNPPIGERARTAKLTTSMVRTIKALVAQGSKGVDIAKKFGVTSSSIYAIKDGRTWRHV